MRSEFTFGPRRGGEAGEAGYFEISQLAWQPELMRRRHSCSNLSKNQIIEASYRRQISPVTKQSAEIMRVARLMRRQGARA